MPWMALLQSEYRRIRKGVLELGRTHPIIIPAVVAVAVGVLALAARTGEVLALVAFVPGGLSAVVFFLLSVGALIGFSLSLTAPNISYFDEQFRLVPVRTVEIFVGIRAVPFILVTTLMAIVMSTMVWRLYAVVGVPASGIWAGVFGVLYIGVGIQGAAVAEALRGYRSWKLFAAATFALGCTFVISLLSSFGVQDPWTWLATYLPSASVGPDGVLVTAVPPLHLSAIGVAATPFFSVISWTAYSLRPDPPPRRRKLVVSVPTGNNVFIAFAVWAALTTLRYGPSRNRVVLAVLAGLGAAALLSRIQAGSSVLAILVVFGLFVIASEVALVLSEDRSIGSWLIRTVPVHAWLIGLAWWTSISLLVIAVGTLAAAPSILGFTHSSIVDVAPIAILYASSAAVVGRVLPWSRQSLPKQFLTSFAVTVGAAAGYAAIIGVAARTEAFVGSALPAAAFAAGLIVVSAGLCAVIEVIDS